ncbi:hypothetical protein ACFL04_03380 [Patescibacteria group bacterium]
MKLKQKSYIYLLAGLVIVFGLFILVIGPQKEIISSTYTKIGGLTADRNLAQQQVQQSEAFQTEYEQVIDKEKLINKYFFNIGEEIDFFQLFEQLATDNNLAQTINFSPTDDSAKLNVIPTTLFIEGDLDNVISYINSLEHIEQYLLLSSFEYKESDPDNISLTLDTYWYMNNEN